MSLTSKRPSRTKKDDLLQQVLDQKQKKRLNVDVEHDLYRRIKAHCATHDLKISTKTRELWIEYLSKNSYE